MFGVVFNILCAFGVIINSDILKIGQGLVSMR